MKEVFQFTTIKTLLSDPWEITYGPDDSLWITESKSYKVSKLNLTGTTKRTILDLSNYADPLYKRQFSRAQSPWPQGGLMGMAIHPQFNTGKKYVYLAFVYSYTGQVADSMGAIFVNKLVRFTYDSVSGQLITPTPICDTLPGSSDHNSGRMIIAPVNGVNYLFYAQGDMGAGQFANKYRRNNAQNDSSYQGKILRFNLEQDMDSAAGSGKSYRDSWIPDDNPYNTPSKQFAVWAKGIRNNQGFAKARINGKDILYGASHGPYSDDEVNIIDSMKNYGHPLVVGYSADNNYVGARVGAPPRNSPALSVGASVVPLITDEVAAAVAIGFRYRDPIFSGYGNQTAQFIDSLYINNPGNGSWPSEAWSGMDIDTSSGIPGFKNSLLLGSLKWGRLVKLKLTTNGDSIDHSNNDTVAYFQSQNRFRDIALSPDQKTFYIITDSSKTTSGPSGTNPMPVDCQGCLQKYTFMGYFNDPVTKKSTIPNTIDITTTKTPNTCITADSIVITSVNDTLWVPITGPDGNVMAEIKWGAANANTTLKSSFYINSGSMREDAYKRLYLNRNMTITPTVQPSAKPVYIRLYITAAEYLALKAASNSKGQSSGVVLPADLRILKNVDACGGALTAATTNLPTPIVDSQSTKGFVLQDSVTSFSSFYISSGSMVVLPVKLISFKGSLQNDAALLQWSTTNQKSLASFILERSVDGKEFENIATIIPKTSINGNADYSYIDNDASKQTSLIIYYRLRMVDLDQSYSYSDIINVQFNGSFTVFVYPVPIKDELNARITIAKSDNIQVQVSDMQGHIMYEQTRFVSGGTTEMKINTQSWPSQSYFVKVIAGDNKMIVTKKVIKL